MLGGRGRGGVAGSLTFLIVTSVFRVKKNSISTSSDPARDFRRAITRTAFLFQGKTFSLCLPFNNQQTNSPEFIPKQTSQPKDCATLACTPRETD